MLYIKFGKRVNPKRSDNKEFSFFYFVSIWDDAYWLSLLWYSFHDVFKPNHYAVNLNLFSAVFQLYLNKSRTQLELTKKQRHYFATTKVHLVKTMVLPVVMYECESWTIKKAEHWRIDAFELWCCRRLLRVPWTTRRSTSPS